MFHPFNKLISYVPEQRNEILEFKAGGGFGPDHMVHEPAVSSSLWTADDNIGLLVSNISNQDRAITIQLPEEYSVNELTLIGPEGEREKLNTNNGSINFTIKAAEAVVLKG